MSDTSDDIEYVGQSKYKVTLPTNPTVRRDQDVAEIVRAVERGINALPLGTQAAPSFHPGRFSTDALGWWDASQLDLTDGASITAWPNLLNSDEDTQELLGSGVTFDEGGVAASFNGNSGLKYYNPDGLSDYMRTWFSNPNGDGTVMIVAESFSTSADQVLVTFDNFSWTDFSFRLSPSTATGYSDRLLMHSQGRFDSGDIICGTGGRRIYWYSWNSTDPQTVFGDDDGQRYTTNKTTSVGGGAGSEEGWLGGKANDSGHVGFVGFFHEIVVWGTELSADDRQNALASLAAKWSIAAPEQVAEIIGGTPIETTEAIDDDLQAHKALTTTAHGGLVPSTRSVTGTGGLTGGGNLTIDRTLSADFGDGSGKVVEGDNPRVPPTPVGQPDGKLVGVSSDALAYIDPPDDEQVILVDPGTPAYTPGDDNVETAITSVWGIDPSGDPYYDAANVDDGDQAALYWSVDEQEYFLLRYTSLD